MSKIAAAQIVEQRIHLVPGKLRITEHFFDVPKDYAKPDAGKLRIFARSVQKHEATADPEDEKAKPKQLPWMVYLNGGPGMSCRSPEAHPWTHTVLDKGYQMLYLDQRGTGMSSPVTASTLGLRGDNAVQARYLKLFRADSIVKDCEAIRQTLLKDYPEEKKKWSIMGQSFGGFCGITYLSFHPQGIREAFLYGGLQPLVHGPDEVYRRLYRKVIQRNKAYYDKYPEDVDRVKVIVRFLQRFGDGTVKLPSEGKLSARRFQQIGALFGFHGGIDLVHDIVLHAAYDVEQFGHITRPTLSSIERATGFDDALIYSILHEPIYCEDTAPNWSAHRLQNDYQEFNLQSKGPIYFTGEMVSFHTRFSWMVYKAKTTQIYPWMFEDYSELRKVQDVANRVAADPAWGPLFDKTQLAKNEVPVYAAIYVDDMYVDYGLASETALAIKGCKTFVSNVMYHDAIRAKMDEVVKQLFALKEDTLD
ncbi:hypothetical protein LTR50_002371 [Elasticomyces elasticus]|nr:hypothetical protein LTR50_002371 [Elasticomyces elasticus]